jgi:hypothetical protein
VRFIANGKTGTQCRFRYEFGTFGPANVSNRLNFFQIRKIAPSMEQIRISNAKNSPQFTGATGPLNVSVRVYFSESASHELKRSQESIETIIMFVKSRSYVIGRDTANLLASFYGMALALPLAN